MLKAAQLYIDQIHQKEWETAYDLDYMYFSSGSGMSALQLQDNNFDKHMLASVDENDNVLGVIGYSVYDPGKSVDNFGIVSFDRGNIKFIKDVCQAIYDIFFKYNFERLEFYCFAENPALRGYRKFIEKCGGRQCGYRRNYVMLADRKLHDSISFEILKDEFKPEYLIKILKRR